ncbi:hypothetical protein [Sinomonas humi]|nr:hypothetical protein [Sinomonas humi]
MSEEPHGAVDRALALLDEAGSLSGAERAEAFERFHDALAAALDEEPGG